ncbi:MAG: ABC transporter, partial [Nitrospiria bacterium]
DEPTGNLDSANGRRVIDLLLHLHRDQGSILILVTHDPSLASLANRVISLRDGRIVGDEQRESRD